MPNWCFNKLTVYPKYQNIESITKFKNWLDDPGFTFDSLIPYPERYMNMDDEYPSYNAENREDLLAAYSTKWGTDKNGYNSGEYEWCVENWGTKWDIEKPTDYYCDDSCCKLEFETAWSPPFPVINKLAEMFPELVFELKFEEETAGVCGSRSWNYE